MRRLMIGFAVVAGAAFVGCTPSPEQLCKDGIQVTCDKVFECTPAEQRDTDFFKGLYGANAAECKTKMEEAAECSKKTAENACEGGKTYNAGKAQECLDAAKAAKCDATETPKACEEVCK